MKFLTILALAAAFLTSCKAVAPTEWQGTPNPLDTPEVNMRRPESYGRFGPFGGNQFP